MLVQQRGSVPNLKPSYRSGHSLGTSYRNALAEFLLQKISLLAGSDRDSKHVILVLMRPNDESCAVINLPLFPPPATSPFDVGSVGDTPLTCSGGCHGQLRGGLRGQSFRHVSICSRSSTIEAVGPGFAGDFSNQPRTTTRAVPNDTTKPIRQ